jgi:hypothetical protein
MEQLPWTTVGEDPRCFAWGEAPWCLTWTSFVAGTFKLMRLDTGLVVPLDPQITDQISGKNWIPVVANDGGLYLIGQISPPLVLKYDGYANGVGNLSWHAGNLSSKQNPVIFRGGTPAVSFEADGINGYVGLGHITDTFDDHSLYAYVFSSDLKSSSVVKVQMPPELMEKYCEGGVWDPFSVDTSGHDIVFSIQYTPKSIGDGINIVETYMLSLGDKSVLAASIPASINFGGGNQQAWKIRQLQSELITAWKNDKLHECAERHTPVGASTIWHGHA